MSRLFQRDFDQAVNRICAEWEIDEHSNWARATVGPFTLEIQQRDDGSIGWVNVDTRVGGGVQLWRSRNEQRVPLPEVIDGMREYLRGVAEELTALEPTEEHDR